MKWILLFAAALAAGLAQAATITDVRVSGAGPVTFGQVFAVGDVKKTDVLVGAIGTTAVPLQVDVKATHADGSVRHAIISAQVPKAGTMQLNTGGVPAVAGTVPSSLPQVISSATIGGVKYSASPSGAFKASWLQGPIVNEWQSATPLTTADGVTHPHLMARFAIRSYAASKAVRVDVTIENNWAYEPAPQNFTYDADISIDGKSVYSRAALKHFNHARWRKVFWDGPTVQLNTKYLIASKAVPNYDQSLVVPESVLAGYGAYTEPMTLGLATPYMPTTGGRGDIGILPNWAATYVLTMDERVRQATLSTADLAGSWSSHYRDRNTDRPVSLKQFPYMTILGRPGDTFNPAKKKFDSFPDCGGDCSTPYTHDTSHQPNLAYLPYLVTGDYYYLEELQFWAMWDAFSSNPGYRDNVAGLVRSDQARGQAWTMRTLAEAAYITPDADALKVDLVGFLNNNLDWYNATYTNSATANKLGVLVNGFAISYGDSGIAPWQDDFFTASIGHAADLGFDKAVPLLKWKSKYPVDRMTAPGACWIDGAVYSMNVKPSGAAPFYETLGEAYKANHTPDNNALACNSPAMAAAWNLKVGEMTGYANSAMGYPSNMQPALAYAADVLGDSGKAAWTLFMNRSVKPDYAAAPQFNIVPRSFVATITTPSAVANAPVVTAVLFAAPTAPGTWAKIANEGAAFTVPAGTFVRYGVGTSWIYSKDSGFATNPYFGKDPAVQVVKTVEAFTPAAPVVPAKVTTGSNTKLAKQTGMTVVFLDPVKLSVVKSFTGVTATSKGAFTVSDVLLQPGAQYLIAVISSAGKPLDAFLLTVPK